MLNRIAIKETLCTLGWSALWFGGWLTLHWYTISKFTF